MALTLPRARPGQPLLRPRRTSRRRLSLASLAFTAALGAVLLLNSLSVSARPAVTASIAGPQPSVAVEREAALAEQSGSISGSLGSPLGDSLTAEVLGHASPAPSTMEARAAAPTPPLQEPTPEASPVASSLAPEHTAAPQGLLDCEDHGPLYCVYQVKPGETLGTIARTAGISASGDLSAVDLLVASNHAAIESASDTLMAGDKLRIPAQNGVLHTVVAAETLSDIARRYGVKAEEIVAVPGNKISDDDLLTAGAEILVPNPTKLGRVSAPAGTTGHGGGSGELAWPVVGEITSYFGPSHPLGIDIALMPGDPVNAAGSGVVTFAGGDPCCSYGLFVIIDHGNGLTTLYGHLSVIYVDEGERVDLGDRIGLGGYTGFGTGPHLHFEVHEDNMLMDPLSYLP